MTLQLSKPESIDLSGAVDKFLSGFYGAKQQKNQEKYRKLQPQIDLINHIVGDPDQTMNTKIKAMDSLAYVLGAPPKDGISVSRHLGLDKLAEQDVEVEPAKTKKGAAATGDYADITANAANGEDPDRASYAEASKQFNTDSVPLIRKRGDLSTNDYKQYQALKMIGAKDESEFERQYKLALVQSRLQETVLNKQGWKVDKDGEWNFNPSTNTYTQDYFNPMTKETYSRHLPPGVVPLSILQTKIKSSGPTAALKSLIPGIAAALNLPEDDDRVVAKASEMLVNLTGAKVDYLHAGIAGTRPSDKRGDDYLDLAKGKNKKEDIKISSEADAAEGEVTRLANLKGDWNEGTGAYGEAKRQKQLMDTYVNENSLAAEDLPEDKGYQKARTDYEQALDKANKLNDEYSKAVTKAQGLRGQAGSGNSYDNPDKSLGEEYPQAVMDLIKQVRSKNPKTKKTNQQIVQELISAGIIITK